MAKFPSDFPLHKAFGQSMARGVVPVIGGLVMAVAAIIKNKIKHV